MAGITDYMADFRAHFRLQSTLGHTSPNVFERHSAKSPVAVSELA